MKEALEIYVAMAILVISKQKTVPNIIIDLGSLLRIQPDSFKGEREIPKTLSATMEPTITKNVFINTMKLTITKNVFMNTMKIVHHNQSNNIKRHFTKIPKHHPITEKMDNKISKHT